MDVQTRALFELAGRQHGVVARAQLLRLGWGRGAIEHALATGLLHRLHRGVYAVGRPQVSDRGRWLGAVMACGPRAVLSHRSAAALWQIRAWPARLVELSSRRSRRDDGLLVHRSEVPDDERVMLDRIPVTTPARTLIDLAEVVSPSELELAIHQCHRLGRFDPDDVARLLEAHGRNGAARVQRALADDPAGGQVTRSILEIRMLRLCRKHGIPKPQVNVIVEGRERDFYWPEQRLVVETDGRASHLTPLAFEDDHERDTLLMEAGYRVRRFTYRQVSERPAWVAARLRAALGLSA